MAPKKKISDFVPQNKNANKHTARGLGMLNDSIAKDGWLGAMTVAADYETFDGSARLETAYERFGDIEPIIVHSKGDRPVIVVREDIPSADDPRAKRLAIAANRIAQVDLDWDAKILSELTEEIDLSGLFTEEELGDLIGADDENHEKEDFADDQSDQLIESYKILIICDSENQQTELLDRFTDQGLKCQSLIS